MSVSKKFLIAPERKNFGWSPYVEEIVTRESSPKDAVLVIIETTIEGKKFCLFNKFIWDYKIGKKDHQVHSIRA